MKERKIANGFGNCLEKISKNELLEELVQLNVKAMTEAKMRVSRGTNWASIKDVQERTGWGRKKIEDFRDAGKFRYQQNAKGGKYYMT